MSEQGGPTQVYVRGLSRTIPVALLLLLMATTALAAELKFPPLTGRVVDEAGILSPTTINDLTSTLAQHEQAGGEQVVVVTLKSLQGYSIEDFGYQLGRYWGIGQKDKNTGAILIVVPSEHKVRIEVGYGLEGKLTDAICRTIIEDDIVPNFRNRDFDAGVVAGTRSILEVLSGGSLGPSAADLSPGISPNTTGIVAMLALFCLVLIVRAAFSRRYGVYGRVGRRSGYDSFSNFGSSGGGGGGFSGGGGSFGGGGASGSW
jgi:uncharacterized protein